MSHATARSLAILLFLPPAAIAAALILAPILARLAALAQTLRALP